jgi:hypothetical protein|tara:strand:- start:53 stop:361 length:309 start_codon:yes stop_codon:yes gene_type:complete
METKKTFKTEIHAQEIQLVKGEFTPSQASDVIMALINQKINYHKIEGLQNWERNHKYDQEPLNNRINELEEEKRIAADFISKMREQGKNLKIKGIIEMTASE